MRARSMLRATVPMLTLSLVLVACGDDDDDARRAPTTTEAEAENEELCALAEEIFEQEDFPSAAQIEQLHRAGPAGDRGRRRASPVRRSSRPTATRSAFFTGIADDDVEAADLRDQRLGARELRDRARAALPGGGERDRSGGHAGRRDGQRVHRSSSTRSSPPAGSSFVMTNAGEEAHFMVAHPHPRGPHPRGGARLRGRPRGGRASPRTSEYDSGLAAPGGEDEEVITVELRAGQLGDALLHLRPRTARPTPSAAWRCRSPSADGGLQD